MKNQPLFVISAIVLVLAAIAFGCRDRLFSDPEQQALLNEIDKIDLKGMEPPVADKIERLRAEVKNNSNSAAAWGKLAMNLDAADLNEAAVDAYKYVAKQDPSDFRWPYFVAIHESEIGADDTTTWFERAISIKGDYAPLIVRHADVLFQRGKLEEAASEYQRAIQCDPKAAHAYYGLAQVAVAKNDLQSARTQLQKAFENDPSYGEAYNLLATVCRRLNDAACSQEATAAAKQLPLKSQLPDAIYGQIAQEGESSLWHRARGSEYMKQKAYDAAIDEFQKAIAIRSDVQTHEDLAQAYSAAGNLQEALAQYQQVVRDHPTAQNYSGLALTYAKMSSFDQAKEFFQKAIDAKPDFAEAYFNLAVANAKLGNATETIHALQRAVQIKPDYTEAHYHLALAYLQTNRRESAMNECKIVKQQNPAAGTQLENIIHAH